MTNRVRHLYLPPGIDLPRQRERAAALLAEGFPVTLHMHAEGEQCNGRPCESSSLVTGSKE